MNVYVVYWYEKVPNPFLYREDWPWQSFRKTFNNKYDANVFADYLVSTDYEPTVKNVRVENY